MKKVLVPTTIIPQNLYVERGADEQLSNVIEDMGRPAYVLVARQMGKTNLLINAKRKLEGPNDIFAYIDLSNRFDTEQECFRNIIDTILDTNGDIFENLKIKIENERKEANIAPHREHAKELRQLLSAISGKLIINLDEVDSLTAADYSDKIFAQIRSIYFERINYKAYERLGYIISGVTEPGDIIKDKSISPFNIGQKILLGDFTLNEFLSLVEKANLKIPNEISDRVFYWANGNPRLSWEICSELEDLIITGNKIDENSVDSIVKILYLANFDKPPLDHIRSLVQSDKTLRKSVKEILLGNTDNLSDKVKNKLYLAGILGSNFEYGDIRIKNRLVETSLDIDWLNKLEKSEGLSIVAADEHFSSGNYQRASEIYSYLLEEKLTNENEIQHASYKLGVCFFNLGGYQQSINCYEDHLFDKDGYRDIYIEQIYTLGTSYLQLNEYEKALDYLEEVIKEKSKDFYYASLLSKSAILVKLDRNINFDKAISINKQILSDASDGIPIKSEEIAGAYFNLGALYEESDSQQSFLNFFKSYEASPSYLKLTPLIAALRTNPKKADKLWELIIASIDSGEIKINPQSHSGLEFSLAHFSELIHIAIYIESITEIDLLLNKFTEKCIPDKTKFSEILLEIASEFYTNNDYKNASFLFSKAANLDREHSTSIDIFTANKFLSFIDTNNELAHKCYFKGFQNYIESIDLIDVVIFERKIISFMNHKDFNKAKKYCDLIIFQQSLKTHSVKVQLLTILFLKMRSIENQSEILDQATEIKNIIDNIKADDLKLTHINEETLKNIRKQTESTIVSSTQIEQVIRKGKRYGRNEKVKVVYEDGREEIKKYKLIQKSLSKGLCKIVE